MKELIKITTNEQGQQLVSARELHEFLDVKSRFNDWIRIKIEKYGFEENEDYTKILVQCNRGQNQYDYAVTTDMAKELSMVENNDNGKTARKYFIECEKKLIQIKKDSYMIDDPIERAKRWIEEQEEKKQALLQLEKAKPKLEAYNQFMDSDGTYTVTNVAKMLGVQPRKFLFPLLRKKGYLYQKGTTPTQQGLEKGLKVIVNKEGHELLKVTPYGVEKIKSLIEKNK